MLLRAARLLLESSTGTAIRFIERSLAILFVRPVTRRKAMLRMQSECQGMFKARQPRVQKLQGLIRSPFWRLGGLDS